MADSLCELNLSSRCRSTFSRLAAPMRTALGSGTSVGIGGGSAVVEKSIAAVRNAGENARENVVKLKSRITGERGRGGGRHDDGGGGSGGGRGTGSTSNTNAVSFTVTLFPELRQRLEDAWTGTAPYHEALFAALVGAALYCALGGRWMSIAPSDVRSFGAFARPNVGSLPATMEYATTAERSKILAMGRRFGCHTCGVRRPRVGALGTAFIADHQPPKKIAREANRRLWRRVTGWKVRQQFLPQCSSCSQVQSAAVKNLATTRFDGRVVTHHATIRLYHWTGGLLVALACGVDRATAELLPGESTRPTGGRMSAGGVIPEAKRSRK